MQHRLRTHFGSRLVPETPRAGPRFTGTRPSAHKTRHADKVGAATGAGKSNDAGKDKGIVDAATGDGKGKGSNGKGNDGKGTDGKDGTDKGIGKCKDAGKVARSMAITVPVPEETLREDMVDL